MSAEVAKKAVDLGLLEEDDEFEEFPTKEWNVKGDEDDVNVWEDNWDDDAVEDDFSVQLSTYSRKRPHSHSPPLRSPEPLAKKVCSRPTPPSSPVSSGRSSRRNNVSNGVSNGHNNGTTNNTTTHQGDTEMQDTESRNTRRSSSRRSNNSSRESSESRNQQQAPATRSSARLRSSRK